MLGIYRMAQEENVILHSTVDHLGLEPRHLARHDGTNRRAACEKEVYDSQAILDVAVGEFGTVGPCQSKGGNGMPRRP